MLNLDRVTPDADDIVRMQRGRPTSVASEITEEATRQRKMELDNSIKAALERASKEAAERSGETRASIQRGMGGAIVGGLAAVEPVTGALIGAGVSEAVLSRAVPALLGHPTIGPKFARWALNAGKQTKGEIATSLGAVLAGNLTAPEREARDTILFRSRGRHPTQHYLTRTCSGSAILPDASLWTTAATRKCEPSKTATTMMRKTDETQVPREAGVKIDGR